MPIIRVGGEEDIRQILGPFDVGVIPCIVEVLFNRDALNACLANDARFCFLPFRRCQQIPQCFAVDPEDVHLARLFLLLYEHVFRMHDDAVGAASEAEVSAKSIAFREFLGGISDVAALTGHRIYDYLLCCESVLLFGRDRSEIVPVPFDLGPNNDGLRFGRHNVVVHKTLLPSSLDSALPSTTDGGH